LHKKVLREKGLRGRDKRGQSIHQNAVGPLKSE